MKKILSIITAICILAVISLTPLQVSAETAENINMDLSDGTVDVMSTTAEAPYGWLGFVTSTQINGWVYLPDSPEEAVDVLIVLNNLNTGTSHHMPIVTANIYRSDVEEAGYGTGNYGFVCYTSWDSVYPGNYEVDAYAVVDGQTYLIHGCPETYTNHGVCNYGLPNYVMKGASQQLWATFEMSSATVEFSYSVPDIVSASSKGIVSGRSGGKTYVIATFTDPSTGQTRTNVLTFYCRESLGLSDGTKYYIMNKSSGRFLAVANTSDAIGTNVVTVEETTATTAQWTLDNNSDYLSAGYVTLTNVSSATGKMLDVEGTNVDIWSHTGSGCQYFVIYRAEDFDGDNCQGKYVIRYGNYYVTQDANYNVVLTSSPSSRSYWSFMKANRGIAYYGSTYYETVNEDGTTSIFDLGVHGEDFVSTFDSFNYVGIHVDNPMPISAQANLKNSDIAVIAAHSAPGLVSFNYKDGSVTGHLAINNTVVSIYNVSSLGDNVYLSPGTDGVLYNEFSDIQFMFYLGCNSGVDFVEEQWGITIGPYNLVDETYKRGAHFVMGASVTIYVSEVNRFLCEFLSLSQQQDHTMSLSSAIKEAMRRASYYSFYYKATDENGNYIRVTDTCDFPYYCVGDGDQLIYF